MIDGSRKSPFRCKIFIQATVFMFKVMGPEHVLPGDLFHLTARQVAGIVKLPDKPLTQPKGASASGPLLSRSAPVGISD